MLSEVSVVICAHNAETTINRTLRSIKPLLIHGIRIIIVDDASSDKTWQILEEFRAIYSSIELVRIFRGGSAGARNAGLSLVSSKYVMFCDSDDEIASSNFGILDSLDLEVDFIVFDYELIQANQMKMKKTLKGVLGAKKIEELSFEMKTFLMGEMGFWRYIYRTSFLKENKIRFIGELDEIRADYFVLDDYFFLLGVLSQASTFIYIPRTIYYYFFNSSASYQRFRRQSRFMGRAANIQMKEMEDELSKKPVGWFGSMLTKQLFSSFRALSLADTYQYSPSFAKAIWQANKKFREVSFYITILNFCEILRIITRKTLLRIIRLWTRTK